MTFTKLYLLPSAFPLNEQLEILKDRSQENLKVVFGSADLSIVNGDTIENTIAPLSIEQVRQLQLTVLHAPLQHTKRIIFIPQIELASDPAQNALLKLLEEPPAHIQFVLTTTQLSSVLETIQSRSELIPISHAKSETQEFRLTDTLQELFTTFPAKNFSVSDVFQLSETYKDRAQGVLLFQAVIEFLHSKLRLHPTPQLLAHLKSALVASQYLEKNVNTRLVVEEYFFQFLVRPHP